MHIGFLGATSQIAKDLTVFFLMEGNHNLQLFSRRPDDVNDWLNSLNLSSNCFVGDFSLFGSQHLDVIINCVGVGDPKVAKLMAKEVFDVTLKYDDLALQYLERNPKCRYIFLSSGAAYGNNFNEPANSKTRACFPINHSSSADWYGVAKFYAEIRHRSTPALSIVDLRIFSYFSHSQNLKSSFLMSDVVRSILDKTLLLTLSDDIIRDFIDPKDLYNLIKVIIFSEHINIALDCYSRAPVSKFDLLSAMNKHFELRYEIKQSSLGSNTTAVKPHYYSVNKLASNLGYIPNSTSLEAILVETRKILAI